MDEYVPARLLSTQPGFRLPVGLSLRCVTGDRTAVKATATPLHEQRTQRGACRGTDLGGDVTNDAKTVAWIIEVEQAASHALAAVPDYMHTVQPHAAQGSTELRFSALIGNCEADGWELKATIKAAMQDVIDRGDDPHLVDMRGAQGERHWNQLLRRLA